MARTVLVDSATDPRLADYRALTDVELRRRSEPAEGIFIAEGELVIRRALRAGYRPRSALMSPRWLPTFEPILAEVDAELFVGDDTLLESVTGFHVHRGALAAIARRPLPDAVAVTRAARSVVVLEDVNSHTNLGAIFRAAAGLGMDGVLLSPRCADPLYRRCVRVSMGEVFAIPYARLEDWPGAIRSLRADGFEVLALTPSPDAVDIAGVRLSDGAKVALLLGAEGSGLSAVAQAGASRRIRIPMSAGVDSLNVAAAAAVACYALSRARAGGGVPRG